MSASGRKETSLPPGSDFAVQLRRRVHLCIAGASRTIGDVATEEQEREEPL